MAAVSNQLAARRIEAIALCGQPASYLELAGAIEAELGIPVHLIDPFRGAQLGRALVESPPPHPGRFAPLVGMIHAELRPAKHAVDFLHPRRRPQVADPRKKWQLAAAVAAALVLAWFVYSGVHHYLLDRRVRQLSQESKALGRQIDEAKRAHAKAAEIVKWADEEVNWLDRFYAINQSLPPADQAVLGDTTAVSGPHGGEIVLRGWVAAPDDITRLAESLRTHGYKMNQRRSGEDRSVAPYTSYFEAAILAGEDKKP